MRVEAPAARTVCQYTGEIASDAMLSACDAAVCDEADSSEDR